MWISKNVGCSGECTQEGRLPTCKFAIVRADIWWGVGAVITRTTIQRPSPARSIHLSESRTLHHEHRYHRRRGDLLLWSLLLRTYSPTSHFGLIL